MRINFLFAFAALLIALPARPLRAQTGPATVKLNVDDGADDLLDAADVLGICSG